MKGRGGWCSVCMGLWVVFGDGGRGCSGGGNGGAPKQPSGMLAARKRNQVCLARSCHRIVPQGGIEGKKKSDLSTEGKGNEETVC